jgi:glycyl-tRNA synthetase beta chain
MEKELFLEIGSEEIPAGFIPKAMADMEALIRKELNGAHIALRSKNSGHSQAGLLSRM